MAAKSDRAVILKAYQTVRGGAVKHVEAALPRLGEMVQKYACPGLKVAAASAPARAECSGHRFPGNRPITVPCL